MESPATPQEADLDGARSKCGTITNFIPLKGKVWCQVSSQCLKFFGTGKLVAWLSHQIRLGQDEFSEREQLVDVLRLNESVFRDANPAYVAKSLLDWNRDHLLTQARSELRQEHKVESLNKCINELQQQAYAQRLDLENAHHGYVEFRREQVRL